MSAWVDCAACVHGWTDTHDRSQAGWFAIRAGEAHEIDPITRHHVHGDCAVDLRAKYQAQKAGAA